jgi:calcineurin-like phosphoesterase family protein
MFGKKIENSIKGKKPILRPYYPPKFGRKFLISDLHLDHPNIIKYCRFDLFKKGDVLTMNEVLIHNWNHAVSNSDTVFFLGDLIPEWYKPYYFNRFFHYTDEILNGNIICIKGNHEAPFGKRLPRFKPLRYRNTNFLLIHDLDTIKEIKEEYDFSNFRYDWVIHGHHHCNKMKKFPFINGKGKTINVSAELLNYQPLDFDKLLSLDINSIKRMETITSPIIRK